MNNPKWIEFEGRKVRSFQLEDEPEIIYVIKNRKDEYIIVHADAYDLHTGKTDIINSAEIKKQYGIDI